ncbi:dead end protein 1 [Trichomycterus rosablanca]|uniref:dead end protein 1 n=1 Tax=Trichomycterus rosablanca TaxID=2290929 RepID=UPI002F352F5F
MERNMLEALNSQNLKSLEEWLQKTSITLTQVNGQRKYGGPPPDWRGPTPGPGCEVFISQIPRNVFEDQLIPLFQSVAPLYEFRLMMNFSGQNRGFAYAKYGDVDGAAAAIRAFHMYPLQAGVTLLVSKSTEKRQLCLGDLPSTIERNELHAVLCQISEGVEGVTVKTAGHKGKSVSAIVYYSSHYAASMAKKLLVQAFWKLYGISISVRWISYSHKSRHEERNEEAPLTPLSKNCFTPALSQDPLPPPPPTPSPSLHQHYFSQAVGGPALRANSVVVPQSPRIAGEPFHNSVQQLRWMCELQGLGVPLYNVEYHHTGPDGTLYFTYKVAVPGLPVPLCGVVRILLSTSSCNMEAEVHQAVATQLLRAMCQAQVP